ncbi:hypothetical protein R3P38DRAFT_2812324 [Favolaschia claudopus]|uniref:Uncharacterized protein n=1 Tax=Favolaschia claudopus TaxID=2862362 RepID=A0AAV9Z6W7_9AGAR
MDSVTASEIGLLLGRIPGTDQESKTSLWPPQDIFKSSTWVVRGYLSVRAFKLLESVRKEIFGPVPSLRWRNRGAWNQFFRSVRYNSTLIKEKEFKGVVPSAANFEEGHRLFTKSYPVDWRDMNISDIMILPKAPTVSLDQCAMSCRSMQIETGVDPLLILSVRIIKSVPRGGRILGFETARHLDACWAKRNIVYIKFEKWNL